MKHVFRGGHFYRIYRIGHDLHDDQALCLRLQAESGNEQGGCLYMELRVGGVYSLPNGRELIVLGRRQNGHISYRLSSPNGRYEISEQGRLVCNGKLTAWDVSNLTDTGRSIGVERTQPQMHLRPATVPS